jgi:glycosyltransferase involved in cell wall biosynthesis
MRLEAKLVKLYHRHLIERASLGLWHGEDCYRGYSPWCRENHLVHDIHTKQADQVDSSTLEAKVAEVRAGAELRVCYAGRLDPIKAPLEWVRAIAAARAEGVRVRATWFGEGPLLDEARAEVSRLGLTDVVTYPGFIAGRAEMLAQLRSAHVLVFTHITPESPRILLESLVSGTPIVGYDIPFAADLLEDRGGGLLVPMQDSSALGRAIAALDRNREALARSIEDAARNGRRFSDAEVFRERSALVRQFS